MIQGYPYFRKPPNGENPILKKLDSWIVTTKNSSIIVGFYRIAIHHYCNNYNYINHGETVELTMKDGQIGSELWSIRDMCNDETSCWILFFCLVGQGHPVLKNDGVRQLGW